MKTKLMKMNHMTSQKLVSTGAPLFLLSSVVRMNGG